MFHCRHISLCLQSAVHNYFNSIVSIFHCRYIPQCLHAVVCILLCLHFIVFIFHCRYILLCLHSVVYVLLRPCFNVSIFRAVCTSAPLCFSMSKPHIVYIPLCLHSSVFTYRCLFSILYNNARNLYSNVFTFYSVRITLSKIHCVYNLPRLYFRVSVSCCLYSSECL